MGTVSLGSPTVTGGCGAVTLSYAPNPIPVGSNTITWTATDASSNTGTCTQSVNVIPSTVSFPGSFAAQSVSNTTYALTGGLPEGGTYSGAGVTGGNFNASVAGIGTHTITYSYTYLYADGTSCPGTATNTITVAEAPMASVTNRSDLTCFASADGTITIQASGGSGSGYQFSIDNGANYASGPNPYTFSGLSAGVEYRVRVKDSIGIESPAIP
jgi:hypothetical protein